MVIDWVQVGNPGNAPDTAAPACYSTPGSCGSVSYTYYISKYDTTNAQYAEFLNAVDAEGSDAHLLYDTAMGTDSSNGGIGFVDGNPSGSKYVVNSGFADKPVVRVSFYSALRFANWLDNGQGSGSTETGAYTITGPGIAVNSILRNVGANVFLPSEDEWYKAAYYDPINQRYLAYPAGSSSPTVCAAPSAAPNTANCGNVVGRVTDVGAYSGSASPYGAYDMGGNVLQWNEQIVHFVSRAIRGGAFNSSADDLAASGAGSAFPPSVAEPNDVGFRVASLVPEPDTGLLVMTGLLGLAAGRRRRVRPIG